MALFETLADPRRHADTVQDAVLRELSDMLNTRAGAVPASPEYGLPDLTALLDELPVSAPHIAAVFQDRIMRFSAMLTRVKVTPDAYADRGRLSFQISARLRGDAQGQNLFLTTQLSSDGQVVVR